MEASASRTTFAAAAAIIAIASIASTPAMARHHGMQMAAKVHCYGVNSCKGSSDCKTAHNDCKGMNSCKGMGFKAMSAAKCTSAGGSLTEKM